MKRNWKIVTFWVLGAVCMMFGSMIAGRIDKTIGVTDASYLLALIVAFILFLFGGLLWVSVAIAVQKVVEE